MPNGVGGGKDDILFGTATNHRRRLGQRYRQGLLTQHVLPGLGGRQGQVVVSNVRGADGNGADVIGLEDIGVIGVDSDRIASAALGQHALGQGALFGIRFRDRNQLNLGQPQHGPQVGVLMPVVKTYRCHAHGSAHSVTALPDSQARKSAA